MYVKKMGGINYHDRYFAPIATSDNGEASKDTVFHYRQDGSIVWATYQGGPIRFGSLIARVDADGSLEMRYQHINASGEFLHGKCRSWPEVLEDGRLRLYERWEWLSGDGSKGESVIEEIANRSGATPEAKGAI
jgi:hypothetical protein